MPIKGRIHARAAGAIGPVILRGRYDKQPCYVHVQKCLPLVAARCSTVRMLQHTPRWLPAVAPDA